MTLPKWQIFCIGFVLGVLPGIWKINQLQQENKQILDTATERIASMQAEYTALNNLAGIRAETLRDMQSACLKVDGSDGTRTILLDVTSQGADTARVNFIDMSVSGGLSSADGLLRIGRALVIPGHVVPQSTDGDLGYLYGYIDSSGKMDGWFTPDRAQ
jgi:hypothetical protein